jgi:hypothetical protein
VNFRRPTWYLGHFFGEVEVHQDFSQGSEAESSFSLSSLSFVSPTTGDVWAKSEVMQGNRLMPFFILTKPGLGEGHRASYGPSGSLLSAGSWMIRHLSPEALRLELLIHCDWAMSRPTDFEEFLLCPKQNSSLAPMFS